MRFGLRVEHAVNKPVDDKLGGFMWVWRNNKWVETCDTCHGNCGQCGNMRRLGNQPASFQAIVRNLLKP